MVSIPTISSSSPQKHQQSQQQQPRHGRNGDWKSILSIMVVIAISLLSLWNGTKSTSQISATFATDRRNFNYDSTAVVNGDEIHDNFNGNRSNIETENPVTNTNGSNSTTFSSRHESLFPSKSTSTMPPESNGGDDGSDGDTSTTQQQQQQGIRIKIGDIMSKMVIISGYWMIPENPRPKHDVETFRKELSIVMNTFRNWSYTDEYVGMKLYYHHNVPSSSIIIRQQQIEADSTAAAASQVSANISNSSRSVPVNVPSLLYHPNYTTMIEPLVKDFNDIYVRPGYIRNSEFRYTPLNPAVSSSTPSADTVAPSSSTKITTTRKAGTSSESEKLLFPNNQKSDNDNDDDDYSYLLLSQEARKLIDCCCIYQPLLGKWNTYAMNHKNDKSIGQRRLLEVNRIGYQQVVTVWISKLNIIQNVIIENEEKIKNINLDVSKTGNDNYYHYYAWLDGGLPEDILEQVPSRYIDTDHVYLRDSILKVGNLSIEYSAGVIIGTATPFLTFIKGYKEQLLSIIEDTSKNFPFCYDEEGIITTWYKNSSSVTTRNVTMKWQDWGRNKNKPMKKKKTKKGNG